MKRKMASVTSLHPVLSKETCGSLSRGLPLGLLGGVNGVKITRLAAHFCS